MEKIIFEKSTKNFKKGVDKQNYMGYHNKAVAKAQGKPRVSSDQQHLENCIVQKSTQPKCINTKM